MDRAWDTSKYHPHLSVSMSKVKLIQRRDVKGQTENFGFGIHVLGRFFSKKARNDSLTTEHILKGQIQTKKNVKTGIPGHSVKSGHFRPSKQQNQEFFSICEHSILYTYIPDSAISHIFRFF